MIEKGERMYQTDPCELVVLGKKTRLLDQGACLGAVVNHKSVMWVILVILCAALGKYWGTKLLNASTVKLTSTEPLQRLSLFT